MFKTPIREGSSAYEKGTHGEMIDDPAGLRLFVSSWLGRHCTLIPLKNNLLDYRTREYNGLLYAHGDNRAPKLRLTGLTDMRTESRRRLCLSFVWVVIDAVNRTPRKWTERDLLGTYFLRADVGQPSLLGRSTNFCEISDRFVRCRSPRKSTFSK